MRRPELNLASFLCAQSFAVGTSRPTSPFGSATRPAPRSSSAVRSRSSCTRRRRRSSARTLGETSPPARRRARASTSRGGSRSCARTASFSRRRCTAERSVCTSEHALLAQQRKRHFLPPSRSSVPVPASHACLSLAQLVAPSSYTRVSLQPSLSGSTPARARARARHSSRGSTVSSARRPSRT
mgnify:CR=1 FL=1